MGAHGPKIPPAITALGGVSNGAPEVIDDLIVLTLVDEISDAVIVHDGIRIIHANARAGELSGRPPAELVGRPLESLFPDPEHGAELWPARSRVVSVARPEGGARALTVSEVPLLLRGEPAVAMLLRDPKVGTFSIETVAALDRMRTAAVLAAGLAHEVSNALVALIAALEAMAEIVGAGAGEEMAGDLELAREAASAITALVRDFHAYVRAGAVVGRGSLDPRPAVERALRLAGPRLRRAAHVTARIEDVGTVRVTESALTQIALNLLLNAGDALPAAGAGENRIDVTLERRGDHVCLEVADNGRGIPPSVMTRLFEPLVTTKAGGDPGPAGTAAAAATATVGSSGLGLAICRELARSFGGQISVHVEPGSGTTFRVLLPAE
jgi:signal transduction histidine kinase